MRLLVLTLALSLATLLSACASSDTGTSSTCKSGVAWTGGSQGSPSMTPGQDCIPCHASKGEGPQYSVAGTVYPITASHDADNCMGAAGATIELTDKTGKVFTMTANDAGNFFLDKQSAAPVMPYTAKVVWKGQERAMIAPQYVGACNNCHTANGASGAPGRILLPEPATTTAP